MSPIPAIIDTSVPHVVGDDMRHAIQDAMDALEQVPCEGIGVDGYSLDYLRECENNGNYADYDGPRHVAQIAWRLLEPVLGMINTLQP